MSGRTDPQHDEGADSTFNYLYETQGPDAARDYLNFAVGDTHTAFEAATYGVMQGSGLLPITQVLGRVTGNTDPTDKLALEAAQAQQEHPTAYIAGSTAGSLALMYGIGEGVECAAFLAAA